MNISTWVWRESFSVVVVVVVVVFRRFPIFLFFFFRAERTSDSNSAHRNLLARKFSCQTDPCDPIFGHFIDSASVHSLIIIILKVKVKSRFKIEGLQFKVRS